MTESYGAQPPESPPPPSAATRPSRKVWWIAGGALLLAAAVAVAVVLLTRDDGDDLAGWGQSAPAVAKKLHTCDQPQAFGDVEKCTTATGTVFSVVTSNSQSEQDFFIAIQKDEHSGRCAVVLDGVYIDAATETDLTAAVGIPERFAHDHDGYLLCPVS